MAKRGKKVKQIKLTFYLKQSLQAAKPNLLLIALLILLVTLLFLTFEVIFIDKYFPRTFIGDTNVSLMTKSQASRILSLKFNQRVNQKLQFSSHIIDLATSSSKLDYAVVDEAFQVGHSDSLQQRIKDQFNSLVFKNVLIPKVSFNLDKQLEIIGASIYKQPEDAQLIFDEITTEEGSPSANIQIRQAKDGLELNKEKVEQSVKNYLVFGKLNYQLPTKTITPKITTEHVQKAKQALESSIKEPVKLVFGDDSWVIDIKQLLALLDLSSGQSLLLDQDKTYTFLKKVAYEIDQSVQEGLFEFNPTTKRVTAFKPSQEGRELDIDKTYQLINETLTHTTKTITLPVTTVKPKIQTSDVNSLGIKELLGKGISNFVGSIPNRIYNVNLTAQKINGVLIPPGEIFSFNKAVGDITAATGFKQAYVIKEGRTVLDDGGGVCQDSTTLFRAVLNAGLPVVKRTAHAYRVGYYEQGFPPGLDATVFYPSVDFQFKNDTPAHILIQAYTVGVTLYVDLYGTSDGRVATISRSIVTDSTPPPPELRQDDPTLPKSIIKQVDWAAWGAKVRFTRTVTRGDEEIIKETWTSSYRPWQAVYLVGTKEN